MEIVRHPFAPVYDENSRVLILGTMASEASRRAGFYYMHPQNRFWKILAAVFGEPLPENVGERRAFVLAHSIALWDVLASCRILGSADSSIREPVANDIAGLLQKTRIDTVLTTGGTATRLYRRLIAPQAGIEPVALPSTSPANRTLPFDALVDAYRAALLPLLQ